MINQLYQQAVEISKQVPPDNSEQELLQQKEARRHMYFTNIERCLNDLATRILDTDFSQRVFEAANAGLTKALIYETYGPIGGNATSYYKGIEYECRPLPVQFLAKGPKKGPQNPVYGLKFFTVNGIQTLGDRLRLYLSPFKVHIECEGSLKVFVQWNRGEESEEVDLEDDSEELHVDLE